MNERVRPRLDGTINLGHVLTAATFVVAAASAFYGVKSTTVVLDQRVTSIERSIGSMALAIEKLADKAVVDARQEERINSADKRIERLEVSRPR